MMFHIFVPQAVLCDRWDDDDAYVNGYFWSSQQMFLKFIVIIQLSYLGMMIYEIRSHINHPRRIDHNIVWKFSNCAVAICK